MFEFLADYSNKGDRAVLSTSWFVQVEVEVDELGSLDISDAYLTAPQVGPFR